MQSWNLCSWNYPFTVNLHQQGGEQIEEWDLPSKFGPLFPLTHFCSSADSAWSLLGVGMLILNSLIHHWFANLFQTDWTCRWLQGRRGGDLIRGTEGKSPATASQAQSLEGVFVPYGITLLWKTNLTEQALNTQLSVTSCCYFTLLRCSSGKSSAYASITQRCTPLWLFFFLLFFWLGLVELGRSFRVNN